MEYSQDLHTMFKAIKAFRQLEPEGHKEFSLTNVLVLLYVAYNPGATMADMARTTGLSIQAIQRRLEALGDGNDATPRKAAVVGYGLLKTMPDPVDGRRFITFLTPKGINVMNDVLTHVHPTDVVKFNAPTVDTYKTTGRKIV